jgi:hypothetical protein
MKKIKLFLILCSVLFLSGCTIVRIDTKSIDNIVNVVLSKDNNLYNRVGNGYKYYVPRGVNFVDKFELNEKLYSSGSYYYLYIDSVGYFHKSEVNYEINEDAYFSKLINDNQGYLEINKYENLYFVEFMYNYSKIEALVPKKDLNNTILNASYILSTIKFNDNVIELMFNQDFFTSKEKQYNIFSPNQNTESLSRKWLELYTEEENGY